MKFSKFRIVPLPTEVTEAARRALEAGASDHVLITANSPAAFPCRHCLRWAQPGEEVILFPFASIPPGRPYSETGPIFVHAQRCDRYTATDEYPADLRRSRVLRAYDSQQNIIDAEIVNGSEPEAIISRLLENPQTAFLQARSATRGCFTFGVERA